MPCINAIKLMVSKEAEVSVKMTARVTSDKKNESLPNVKNVIAISSGKGGVGKINCSCQFSCCTCENGCKSRAGRCRYIRSRVSPCFLVFQGERPVMEQTNGRDLLVPFEKHGVKLMSIGVLVRSDQAIVWRGPMASKALRQLIFDTKWGELDYLLVDLPPGTGDIHLTLVQTLPVTGAVVVTTPQKVAVADARKGAEMFRSPQIKVSIIGSSGKTCHIFTPEEAPDKRYYLMGQGGGEALAKALETFVLGENPHAGGKSASKEIAGVLQPWKMVLHFQLPFMNWLSASPSRLPFAMLTAAPYQSGADYYGLTEDGFCCLSSTKTPIFLLIFAVWLRK